MARSKDEIEKLKLEAELAKKMEAFNKHMDSRLSDDTKKKLGLK